MAHWLYYNPNPSKKRVDDCMIRAICAATGKNWNDVHVELSALSYQMGDVQIGNAVWRAYMLKNGFYLHAIPNSCPFCYTVGDFADEHKNGVYLLGTGKHAVAVVDGTVLDTWDSRGECPIYYYSKEA